MTAIEYVGTFKKSSQEKRKAGRYKKEQWHSESKDKSRNIISVQF